MLPARLSHRAACLLCSSSSSSPHSNALLRRSFSRNEALRRQEPVMNVFDRQAKLFQKERAAKSADVSDYDYLKEEIGFRVSDRVLDIKREMDLGVDLGSGRGFVTRHLSGHSLKKVIALELSPTMVEQCQGPAEEENVIFEKICHEIDNQALPFEDASVDIFTSSLALHFVNNLPGLFREVNRCLKPDGVFIGSMFGGETLFELRCSLQMAELERVGGIGSHVSPFVEVQDLGNLLNRCGFTMLTIDSDEEKVAFPSIFELMRDLKGMGENNAAHNRPLHLGRDVLLATSAIYRELYAQEDGSIPATFQVFYWIGWKPDPKQPKPLSPQKSDVSLKDLGTLEQAAKDAVKKKSE